MGLLLRIYCGSYISEYELGPDHSYQIGSAAKDDIVVNGDILPKSCLRIAVTADGWSLSCQGKGFPNAPAGSHWNMQFEKIAVLDAAARIGVSVYKSGVEYIRSVDVSGLNRILVGRSAACDICIGSKQISGEHIEFVRGASGWTYRDLDSANGTYLNGEMKSGGDVSADDTLSIGFCQLKLAGDTLTLISANKVKINIAAPKSLHTVRSIDDEYPYLFKQSPRLTEEIPSEEIEIQAPPTMGGKPTVNWLNILLAPILTVIVMLAVCYFITGAMTMLYFSVPMTLIGALMSIIRYNGEKKEYQKTEQLRFDKYDEYLAEREGYISHCLKEQQRVMTAVSPPAAQCVRIAQGPERTLWDRKSRDHDFMSLRVGGGCVPSAIMVKIPRQTLNLTKDALLDYPLQIARKSKEVPECPITIDLGRYGSCGLIGDREKCVALGKNLIVDAATHHSYDDLRIVVLCDSDEREQWDFCRWLPHCFDDTRSMRYLADSTKQAEKMLLHLTEILSQRDAERNSSEYQRAFSPKPYYLFICATPIFFSHNNALLQYLTENDPRLGVGAVFLFDRMEDLPKDCYYIADLQKRPHVVYAREKASDKRAFSIDALQRERYEVFARALAPLRIEVAGKQGTLPTSVSFLQGYSALTPQELHVEENWNNAFPERSMAVPIGIRECGEPFYFDIHEKQFGPHGLVAGMTGSGKSEMVQTWILSMAVRFPPEAVSFVLIDFKGTGLLLPFKNLPHLAGTISDLDANIGRNLIALENELNRRKALLDKYGVSNISAYLKLLHSGAAKEPLPYLFIVIDEFAEFKQRFPNFMQVVNSIFAIGRTLGVHIILLTQKPASVVDDKMSANTRFRWCLKVASSADSRDMLKHPDAAKIVNPGRAYIQVGEDEVYEPIQSFWSGAPYNPYRKLAMQRASKVSVVDLYGNRICYETEKTTGYRAEKSEIDAVVEYLDNYCRNKNIERAHAIWTTKLPERVYLKDLLHIAFDGEAWSAPDTLFKITVGLLDDPRSQSQYPLYLNLSQDGHTAIYGAPGSGKSTLLHTAVISTALTYAPDQVHIFLMDFGGGSLNIFHTLPHVGGVVVGGEDEKVEKLIMLLGNEMTKRKKMLAAQGLVSIESYNEATGENVPKILLAIDNFAPLAELYPQAVEFLQTYVREGGSCGMYMLATGTSQNAIPYRINQNITNALALRMADKGDYGIVVGRTEGLEPEDFPGRGLARGKPPLEFQAALPTAGKSEVERVANLRALCALMNEKWVGPYVHQIPVLPEKVCCKDTPVNGILLGLSYYDVAPIEIDIRKRQFLLLSTEKASAQCKQAIIMQVVEKIGRCNTICIGPDMDKLGVDSLPAFEFDQKIAQLMPVLQAQKDAKESNRLTEDMYPFVAILIDDLGGTFDSISNDTIRRLTSIGTLGIDLNVIMVVCGESSDIKRLYNGGDLFTINMVKRAPSMLIGGSIQVHGVFDTGLPYSETSAQIDSHSGYFIDSDGATKIKVVEQ